MTPRLIPFGIYATDGNELTAQDRARLRELLGMLGAQKTALVVQRPMHHIEAAAYDDPPYRWTLRDPWEVRTRIEDAVVRWQERLGR